MHTAYKAITAENQTQHNAKHTMRYCKDVGAVVTTELLLHLDSNRVLAPWFFQSGHATILLLGSPV